MLPTLKQLDIALVKSVFGVVLHVIHDEQSDLEPWYSIAYPDHEGHVAKIHSIPESMVEYRVSASICFGSKFLPACRLRDRISKALHLSN